MNIKVKLAIEVLVLVLLVSCREANAEISLVGDYVIDGDLTVGTTLNKTSVTINGKLGSDAPPSLAVYGDGYVLLGGDQGIRWDPVTSFLAIGTGSSTYYIRDGNESLAFYGDAIGGSRNISFDARLEYGNHNFASSSSTVLNGNMCAASSTGSILDSVNSTAEAGGFLQSSNYSFSSSNGSIIYGSVTFAADGFIAASEHSAAFTWGEVISSKQSFAINGGSINYSKYSFAANGGATSADHATAIGQGIAAYTNECFAIGTYNAPEINVDGPEPTDQLFVIGNGTGNAQDHPEVARKNAFWVQRNGDVRITKRQGDILMGEFGNPE